MENAKGLNTSITSGQKLFACGSEPAKDVQFCTSIVRALLYITITRSEITYSVGKICQFMQAPLETN